MEHTNELHITQSVLLPFDPIVLIRDVAKRWLVIVLVVLMSGVGSFFVADSSYSPVYTSTMTFVVTDRSSSSSVYSNLSTTTSLATVFSELLSSSILRATILEELAETTLDAEISAKVIPETNLLTVAVSSASPRTAFLVAQALIEHHHTLTYQVVDGVVLEVLQNPVVPVSPSNPVHHTSLMKKAMLLAAIASVLLLLFASFMKNTVRSSTEAKEKLDCSYLGEVPHEHKKRTRHSIFHRRKSGILVNNPLTSFHFSESIRKLRYRVLQHMHGGKVLMVTSLLENEGKSTISVNLALAMTQKYSKVLLIDCDLRKPACHLLTGHTDLSKGLMAVLTESATLSDIILKDKTSNLYMLLEPNGTQNAAVLLSSDRMRAIIKWARREFDFVIVDLPPMAAAADSESITELADASLLVVRQNLATAPALNKAIESLKNGNAKLLGCVLNNVYSSPLPFNQDSNFGYANYDTYGHYDTYRSK